MKKLVRPKSPICGQDFRKPWLRWAWRTVVNGVNTGDARAAKWGAMALAHSGFIYINEGGLSAPLKKGE